MAAGKIASSASNGVPGFPTGRYENRNSDSPCATYPPCTGLALSGLQSERLKLTTPAMPRSTMRMRTSVHQGSDSFRNRVVPTSDIDIAVADSPKVLDLDRPIREATYLLRGNETTRRANRRHPKTPVGALVCLI